MMFRTRLLLIFAVALTAAVGMVELIVSSSARRAFENMEARRVNAIVAQFDKEFRRRGEEIVRTVEGIADSAVAREIAITPDPSAYLSEAGRFASTNRLDLLELVAADGAIVSSAQWQARFGYKEDWLASEPDWQSRPAFLKQMCIRDRRGSGQLRFERHVQEKALKAQQVGRRMRRGKALGDARELIPLQFSQRAAHSGSGQNFAELLVVLGDVPTDFEEYLRLRHVYSSTDRDFLVRDVHVVAPILVRTRATTEKTGSDVVFVRRLVLAEAGIAIDAINGLRGVGGVFRSEAFHRPVQRFHQVAHGLLDLLFESGLARLKPVTVIISR